MNKLLIATVITALSGVVGIPQTARAGNDGLAALGGFIGGLIVGSTVGHPQNDYDYRPPAYHDGPDIVIDNGPRARGHWEWVTVKVWVPASWVVRYDNCGRSFRDFRPGYFEFRRERTWVDGRRDRRDRNDRRW